MEKTGQFRLLTYNVHSCIGTDGELSPNRVTDVIAAYRPDVVALQELDVNRVRSGKVDQAHTIAQRLEMKFHFHPAVEVKEEKYGDAVLSRFPMHFVRAGKLPTVRAARKLQRRGALWVRLDIDGHQVDVVNTHLGVNPRERMAQVRALMGPEWLGSPKSQLPVILCGDFNAVPASTGYRVMRRKLLEAQRCLPRRQRQRTYPTRYPMLRLDHVFVSQGIEVCDVQVPRTPLSRVASDHYPVIVDLKLNGKDYFGELTSR